MPTPVPSSSSSTSSSSSSAGAGGNTQSSINQVLAAAISRAEEIAQTAQRGPFAAALAAVNLPATFAAGMLTRAADARTAQTAALAADASESGNVDTIDALRAQLTRYMQQAQAWARAAFFFTNPSRLAMYHVGEDLNANLPTLKQFSLDVRTAAVADALAGFNASFQTAYNAARTALFGPDGPVTQPEPDDQAVDQRDALERLVTALTHDAMRVLFLADGIWPYGQAGSAGPRHAFGLPADRPYSPPQPEAPVPANP